jgi:UDP-glucose 4-epimerase
MHYSEQVQKAFRGSTVLVTGGAGFIGSHIAEHALRLGAQVRVLDDLSGGLRSNVPADAQFIQASILESDALHAAVDGCTYVFHQAALVSVPESVEKPEECTRLNIVGTQRVLEQARRAGVKRVMFAASAAAYGNTPTLPCREDQVPDPYSPYAQSKVAGEMLLQAYARCYGLSTVSLRYFNIFGPRQNPTSPYAAAISKFSALLKRGEKPTIFGDGLQTRDWTYIDNVALANLLAASCPRPLAGEVMNIGTGVRISLRDVLLHMGRVLGVDATPTPGPPRAGDIRDSVADIARAKELIGYAPIVAFEEGIARTLKAI